MGPGGIEPPSFGISNILLLYLSRENLIFIEEDVPLKGNFDIPLKEMSSLKEFPLKEMSSLKEFPLKEMS